MVARVLLTALVGTCVALGCGGSTSSTRAPSATDAGATTANIGHACIPSAEEKPAFAGFTESELTIDVGASECVGASVCLVNHFRGRVSCPYGQDASGAGPNGAAGCTTPRTHEKVDASQDAGVVAPQCANRTSEKAVYCSCRCANAGGRTDDGYAYCKCPSGTSCTQLLTSLGAATKDIDGAYCMKDGTAYDAASACTKACDPTAAPCP